MSTLQVRGLRAGYEGLAVLHGVDFEVPTGSLCAMLGANGAGKTTTLRAVMGRAQVLGGEITLDGEPLVTSTRRVVERGVALAPEGRRLFPTLTVEENLAAGSLGAGAWRARHERMAQVFEYFPALRDRRRQTAATLSGGEQQMAALARALMAAPRVLLVDEASLGLSPIMAETLFEILDRVHRDGVTVLAVEQNVALTRYADRVVVLEQGRVEFAGPLSEVGDRLEREVAAAYLGDDQGGP